ncbi:MAG: sodium/glutamate symporter [Gammaproteobacteria bacterium]
MLIDICIISGLLVIAHLLRAGVPWLSRFLIPSSMIAGLIGLALGPGGYDLLPFSRGEDGNTLLGTYPGILIVLLFATLLMGHRPTQLTRETWRGSRTSFLYNLGSEFMQYGVVLCVGVALLAFVFTDLRDEFMVMLPGGFAGGHGTAAVYADAMPQWEAARSIGFTFATLGILCAVFGGLVLVNLARRRGWIARDVPVATADGAHAAPEQSSFLPSLFQTSTGRATVNSIALEPLAWHVALVLAVYGATVTVMPTIRELLPPKFVLPAFVIAMVIGWFVQTALDLAKVGQYVDAKTIGSIGSLASDYLVAFGIASINVQIVLTHAVPLLVFALLGLALCVGWLLIVAPRVFKEHWFESGIFTYGWNTGTIAFGVALLRIVDKRSDSRVLSDYGVAYVAIGPLEAILYTGVLWALATGHLFALGVGLVASATVMAVLAMRSGLAAR